jgi:hypothetical protein
VAEVWTGPGLLTPSSSAVVSVVGQADGSTVAVFPNLALDRAGTYQLRFSTIVIDPDETVRRIGVTSDTFTVLGARPARQGLGEV